MSSFLICLSGIIMRLHRNSNLLRRPIFLWKTPVCLSLPSRRGARRWIAQTVHRMGTEKKHCALYIPMEQKGKMHILFLLLQVLTCEFSRESAVKLVRAIKKGKQPACSRALCVWACGPALFLLGLKRIRENMVLCATR